MSLQKLKQVNADLSTIQWFAGDVSAAAMPAWVAFNAAAICTLSCPHCPSHGTPDRKAAHNALRMDPALLRRLAGETLPFAMTFNPTRLGEPLATPGLLGLLQSWRPLGVTMMITTNGTLMTPEWLEALLPLASMLQFSMDGASPFVFERLRLGARFDTVLKHAWLLGRVRELVADLYNPHLSIACCCMGSNLREWPLLVDLGKFLRFDAVRFDRITVAFDAQAGEATDRHKPQFNYYRRRTIDRGIELGMDVHFFPEPYPGVPEDPAPIPGEGLLVEPPGDDYYARLEPFAAGLDLQALEQEALRVAGRVRQVQSVPIDDRAAGCDVEALTRETEARFREVRAAHSDRLRYLATHHDEPIPYCSFLHQKAFFAPDGSMYACSSSTLPAVGDVTQHSVHELWNGPARRSLCEAIIRGRPHPICERCVQMRMVPVGHLWSLLSADAQAALFS